jgi:hypothetical protein
LAAASLTAVLISNKFGTVLPDLIDGRQTPDSEKLAVNFLLDRVTCDVILSLQTILIQDEGIVKAAQAAGFNEPTQLDWLKKWRARLEFLLTVVEKSDLKGSVGGEKTNLSLAAAYSREATRKEAVSFTYDIQDFSDPKSLSKAREISEHGPSQCDPPGGSSDLLKFIDWLHDVTLGLYVVGSPGAKSSSKITEIKHQVSFVVIYEGKSEPVWKIVSLEIEGQRANTQDITITLSPPETASRRPFH